MPCLALCLRQDRGKTLLLSSLILFWTWTTCRIYTQTLTDFIVRQTTRVLAEEQFMKRALVEKIIRGLPMGMALR